MNRHDDQDGPRRLDEELRSVLGGSEEHFDYDALVAGAKVRARRMRRRRAVAQGAAAAVLVPTLVGTGFLVSSSLQGRGGVEAGPAASSTADVLVTEDAATTSAPVPDGPPFQDAGLLPETPPAETNAEVPNRWQVPDVRPTGVDLLDALGPPQRVSHYPRVVPLDGMVSVGEGYQPHTGASWSFFDGTDDLEQDTVDITVTGWDDSVTVMAALRVDAPVTDARWDGGLAVRPWGAHHDTEHLMVDLPARPTPTVGALIRQGDYLVGVTVAAGTAEEAAAAAGRIAEQAAANLAWLDPEHGQG